MTTKRRKPTGLFGDFLSDAWARRQHKAHALRTTDTRDLKMIRECEELRASFLRRGGADGLIRARDLTRIIRDCRQRIRWRAERDGSRPKPKRMSRQRRIETLRASVAAKAAAMKGTRE